MSEKEQKKDENNEKEIKNIETERVHKNSKEVYKKIQKEIIKDIEGEGNNLQEI